MGYAICMGNCIVCDRLFSFNPMRVPSTSAVTGNREPICKECISRANLQRMAAGLQPIIPQPGAYEPCDEEELGDD